VHAGGTEIGVPGIEQVAGEFLSSGRAVPLAARESIPGRREVIPRRDGRVVAATRGEARYSTPELLVVEREFVERALAGRRAGVAITHHPAVERPIAARPPSLSDEQADMVRRVAQRGERLVVVVGKAKGDRATSRQRFAVRLSAVDVHR
jgi:hypothetical protein